MSLHRHVRDRRFTWLIAIVFTVFLYPTVLWAADEQDSILGRWEVTVKTTYRGTFVNHITYSPGGGMVLVLRDGTSREGTWSHSGGNKFEFTIERFVERGGVTWTNRSNETISITGDTYQGKWKTRTFHPDGKRVNDIEGGTTSAVRLE